MKRGNFEKLSIGLALALLPMAGGCQQQTGISPESTASVTETSGELRYVNASAAAEEQASDSLPSQPEISDSPAKVISTEKPIPPNIRATTALSEMIRLAQSAVDENVMLAYVTNSSSTFSLGPEEIIYLSDLGVPSAVVTAMLQHDRSIIESASTSPRAPIMAEPAPQQMEQTPAESEPPVDVN